MTDSLVSDAMTLMMTDERVVVTGATGYIGSALVADLRDRNEVHALVRDAAAAQSRLGLESDLVHAVGGGSMPIGEAFDRIAPTVVFHLATHYQRRDDPASIAPMIDANVRFGSLVLDAASRRAACDVVVAGSHFQFAGGPNRSSSFYAATKNALCEVARYLQEARDLQWTQPVIYDAYGPGDTRAKLVDVLIDRVESGQAVLLPDPEPLHHFVYVEDVVAALVASARNLRSGEAPNGTSVFVSSDALTSPSDVLGVVASVLGTEPVVSPEHYVLPAGAILQPYDGPRPSGWQPMVGLAEGIGRVVAVRGHQ